MNSPATAPAGTALTSDRIVTPRRVLVAAVCGAIAFSCAMTIVSAVLSDIATDLQSTPSTLSWSVTGLFLAMAVSTPIMGRLGDAHGRRPVFLFGTAITAVAMIGCAVAPNAAMFIGLRVLTGFGIACSMPNAIAMVINAYPPERRAQALGWYQGVIAGVPVLALILGAWMTEHFGWRSVFYFIAPLAVAGFVLGIRDGHDAGERKAGVTIDWWGALALGVAVLSFLVGLERAKRAGFADRAALALFAGALICTIGFVVIEQRTTQPLLRLDYFRRRAFTGPLLAQPTSQFAYMGGMVMAPLMLRHEFELGTSAASWLLLLRPATYAIGAPIGGRLEPRIGVRHLVTIGTVGVAVSMVSFAVAANLNMIAFVFLGLAFSGLATGLAVPGYATAIAGAVEPADLGVANGMSSMVSNLGTLTGIQTMFVVLGDRRGPTAFTEVWLTGAAVAASGIAGALIMRRRV